MDHSYEKKWPSEISTSSSAVLIDGPIHIKREPVKVRHYFLFSIISAICLCPATGLIALAYSVKSSAKADVNFLEKSQLYSRRALFWNLASIVLAVISFIVTLIFCYQLGEMMRVYASQMNQQQANDIDKLLQSIAQNKK